MKNFSLSPRIVEAVIVTAIMLGSIHLFAERISHAGLPDGDEGSWMSVAAEFSHGQGFTTLWYEHPFQKPAILPRPDDFRYPGLVLSLALAFKAFGISYQTALWTVAFIFFLYLLTVYFVCRRAFSVKTAVLTMAVSAASLLQLYWNTTVYSEGLFGLIAGLLILWTISWPDKKKILFWIALGAGCGVLYNVRPNGLLFGAGIAWLYFRERRNGVPFLMPFAAFGTMALVMTPWLIRTWMCFGNPFHISGSAGLLRAASGDPVTLSLCQFFSHYGPFVPVKSTYLGIVPFFEALNFFEHLLFLIPLAGVLTGLILRKKFFNSFVSANALIMLFACFYVSSPNIGSWAGVRYYSSLLPFVYGYGIYSLLALFDSQIKPRVPKMAMIAITAFFCMLLFAPVYYPHRYYERTFRKTAKTNLAFSEHLNSLTALLGEKNAYFAARLGQLNFLTERHCVGIQAFVDSTQVPRLMRCFSPVVLALTPAEMKNERIAAIMREIVREGHTLILADSNRYAYYYRIKDAGGSNTAMDIVR